MLRTQTKKQSSFFVCASCRRQHQHHRQHRAQLPSSSRMPNHHLPATSRPFASTVSPLSNLATSLAPRNGATPSRHVAPLKTTRLHSRPYSIDGKFSFGSPIVPGQSNSAWTAASKKTSTPATTSPASPAWRAPGQLPPATGTSAWRGPSNDSPAAAPTPSWGGGNRMPPGPGGPAWGGSQFVGAPAWGGPSNPSSNPTPVPALGGTNRLPPIPAASAWPPATKIPGMGEVGIATTPAWTPKPTVPATSKTGLQASGGVSPPQAASPGPVQLRGDTPSRSASGFRALNRPPPITQYPDSQFKDGIAGNGVKASPQSFYRTRSESPPVRAARPVLARPSLPPLPTPTPNQTSATSTQPLAPRARSDEIQQYAAPIPPQIAKPQPNLERHSNVAAVIPQSTAKSSTIPPQAMPGHVSSPTPGDISRAPPIAAKAPGTSRAASSNPNQPTDISGTQSTPRLVHPPSGGVSGIPAFGAASRSFPRIATSGAPVGGSIMPAPGPQSGVVPGKPAIGAQSGMIAGKPALGGFPGAVAGVAAFGGSPGMVAGKPMLEGSPGAIPGRPGFAGASGWLPNKPAFAGANAWTPAKRTLGASGTSAKDASTVLGKISASSNWKLTGEVSYTAPLREKRFALNATQDPTSDPIFDTRFTRPPTRKPQPGDEFPQLTRRVSRQENFNSLSPFNLRSKQRAPDSRPTTFPPGSTDKAMISGPAPRGIDSFEASFGNIAESSSSGFPRPFEPRRPPQGTTRARFSTPGDVGEDWGDALPSVVPRSRITYGVDQTAAPAETGRSGQNSDRNRDKDIYAARKKSTRRGIELEQDTDIYAARNKARKKSGGIRKRHTEDDEEGAGDYDSYREQRDWRRQRREQEERQAAEAAAAAATAAPKKILLPEYITVYDLAEALRIKPAIFLRDLEQLGFENTLADSVMTGETAALVAAEYDFETEVESGIDVDLRPRPPPGDLSLVPPRPPIVTIMGHVDHGKTTILDTIRKSSIVAQEFGGITQHIGAFSVKLSKGKTITFLDTPGHAAFLNMRQRGANVTDIVVLVVAVDDSVKPQTIEAIKHAQNANVPMIVAINKVDIDDTPKRLDLVKQDLANNGVEIEDYGGDVQVVAISGMTGRGIGDLEEAILTLSEVLDMRAETDGMAEGWVIEASIKPDGRAATILVKRGTLRVGDLIVSGAAYTRIRIMRNEAGVDVEEAGPGTPMEVYGTWKGEPMAGDMVLQAPNETKAQAAVDYRQEIADRAIAAAQNVERELLERERAEREALKKMQEEQGDDEEQEAEAEPVDVGPKVVSIIVKGDVMGSVEAVSMAIQEIGNNEVRPRILFSSPGQVTESDVDHMATARGAIVNFNNVIPGHVLQRAALAGVVILDHNIIYESVQAVKDLLSAQLAPIYTQRVLAEATVQQIFPINITKRKYKNVAGAKVTNGKITRGGLYRLIRDGEEIHKGKLSQLKQKQSEVKEVGNGIECGIMFEGFDAFEEGDRIQLYEDVEQQRYL